MQDALVTYFTGEKNGGLLLTSLGAIGLGAAAFLWQARWGLRSLAVTLAIFAVIEMAIGIGLYVRTGPQVNSLLAQFASEPARFFSEEAARMVRVQRNFVIVQYIEVAVIVVAAITAFAQKQRFSVAGVALGLVLNAALLLAFDLVAERRGAAYLDTIRAQSHR